MAEYYGFYYSPRREVWHECHPVQGNMACRVTGPHKSLAVGLCPSTGGLPFGDKLLYLGVPVAMRCKCIIHRRLYMEYHEHFAKLHNRGHKAKCPPNGCRNTCSIVSKRRKKAVSSPKNDFEGIRWHSPTKLVCLGPKQMYVGKMTCLMTNR